MGFFDKVVKEGKKVVAEGKKRAEQEQRKTKDLHEFMSHASLQECADTYRRELFRCSSIAKQARWVMCFQKRIMDEENQEVLFSVFEKLHREFHYNKKDTMAYNTAHLIGKRLVELGDPRVDEKKDKNGKSYYFPHGYDFI